MPKKIKIFQPLTTTEVKNGEYTEVMSSSKITNQVILKPNGEVITDPQVLHLGLKGDKNCLQINVNISELLIEENKMEQLINNYTAQLIFKQKDLVIATLSTTQYEGNNLIFTIDETVTSQIGEYTIIFILKEKEDGTGNVDNYQEIFTSASFLGVILDSMLDVYNKHEIIDIPYKEGLLQKPTIKLDWEKDNIKILGQYTILGYSKDKLITDISITPNLLINDPDDNQASYFLLLMNNDDHSNCFKQKMYNRKVFLNEEITKKPGKWILSIAIDNKGIQRKFSTPIIMEVLDNTLKDQSLRTISLQTLQSSKKEDIMALNSTMDTSFMLDFTGEEVNQFLNKTKNLNSITDLDIQNILK